MKVLVILAHPDNKSFNHAIARTCFDALADNGHTAIFHDLYQEQFNPLLPAEEFGRGAVLPSDIQTHCNELSTADGIVIIHPNWWGQPPAILKGWIDRVIRPGVAYEFIEGDKGEGVPRGLLKARSAIVFNTSNTESGREQKVFSDPLEAIWKNCIFGLCGISVFRRRMFNIVITSTEEERKNWLREVAGIMGKYYPKTIA